MPEQVTNYLLQAYGLAGVVIIALGLAVRHLYDRCCKLEDEKVAQVEQRLQEALKSQALIQEFTSATKAVLEVIKAEDGKLRRQK